MPKLNAYTNDPGYFIRAWGPDIGNITYQIKPMGEKVLSDVGYSDEDDLPWPVVNALRAAKLVETGSDQPDKYADQTDDFEPDVEAVEIDSEKAAKIFDLLKTETSVDGDRLDRAQSALGVELQSSDSTDTDDNSHSYPDKIKRRVKHEIDSDTEHSSTLFNPEHEVDVIAPEIKRESEGEYWAKVGFSLVINGGTKQARLGMVFVKIFHKLRHGITDIEVVIDSWESYDDTGGFEQAWGLRAEVNAILADLLPIMESVLNEEEYIAGGATGQVNVSIEHL
jgi:hypothetical protein